MNQFSQQSGNFQGQQSYLNQGQNFQPSGYVQSHYQGQLSQPTFGRTSQSIVANSPGGYQQSYSQGNQSYIPSGYGSINQSTGYNQNNTSHQPVQSHASSPATAFGNVGPVIAHVGYQAGSDMQQSFYQPTSNYNTGMHYGGFNQSFSQGQGQGQGQYGPTPVQSFTHSATPVQDVTNAYQQAGPVISHVGYTANNNNQYR